MLFSRVVRADPLAGLDAINAIHEGYPALILKAAGNCSDVPNAQIQNIAQVSAAATSRLHKKQARVDPPTSERIYRTGSATRMAIGIFGSELAAINWMYQPNWMCQPNRASVRSTPLESMDTGVRLT